MATAFPRPLYTATIQEDDTVQVTVDGLVYEYASMNDAVAAIGKKADALSRPVKLTAIDPRSEQPETYFIVDTDGSVDLDPEPPAKTRAKRSRRSKSDAQGVTLADITEDAVIDSADAPESAESDSLPDENGLDPMPAPNESVPASGSTPAIRQAGILASTQNITKTSDSPSPSPVKEPSGTATENEAPAELGFAGWWNRTFKTALAPSAHERGLRTDEREREDQLQRDRRTRERIQRPLDSHHTIAVVQLKGGGGKTTMAYHLAATYGRVRGGNVLAIEINENQGTLAERSHDAGHERTTLDLIRNLDSLNRRISDLIRYIRPQGDDRFHVLAAPPEGTDRSRVDGSSVATSHELLQSLYGIMIMDTGNSAQATTWKAAVDVSDALVFVAHNREDDFDLLKATVKAVREAGYGNKISKSILAVINTATNNQDRIQRLTEYAQTEGITGTIVVPFEPTLQEGESFDYDRLQPETVAAYHEAVALLTDQL